MTNCSSMNVVVFVSCFFFSFFFSFFFFATGVGQYWAEVGERSNHDAWNGSRVWGGTDWSRHCPSTKYLWWIRQHCCSVAQRPAWWCPASTICRSFSQQGGKKAGVEITCMPAQDINSGGCNNYQNNRDNPKAHTHTHSSAPFLSLFFRGLERCERVGFWTLFFFWVQNLQAFSHVTSQHGALWRVIWSLPGSSVVAQHRLLRIAVWFFCHISQQSFFLLSLSLFSLGMEVSQTLQHQRPVAVTEGSVPNWKPSSKNVRRASQQQHQQ